MREQDLHCLIERKGIDLADGQRQFITKTELKGRGNGKLELSLAGAHSPDDSYAWEKQPIESLTEERRHTWLVEGACHGFRMEFYGQGQIPSSITIHHEDSGE